MQLETCRLVGRAWAWACFVAMASLTACGGGGGGSTVEGPDAGREYFPTTMGDRWIYRAWTAEDEAASQLLLTQVTGAQDVQGRPAVVLRSFNALDGSHGGDRYLSVTDAGVTELPDPSSQPGDLTIPSLDLLKFPLATGSTYTQMDQTFDFGADYDGDGRNESLRVVSEVTVMGKASVRTDAGLLTDTVHVRTVVTQTGIYSSGRSPYTVVSTLDHWYAKGIGLVREDTVTTSPAMPDSSTHLTLVGYSVGGVRSDTVAPVATLTSPTLPGPQAPFTHIRLSYSELMDSATVAADAVQLRDASGALVPLSSVGSGKDWSFYPSDGPLATGSYTVSVSASGTDLVGNPAVPASWSFDVDATAPVVVATSVANDASGVPTDAVFTIDFSEEIDPTSAPGAIQLVGSVYHSVEVTVQGRRLTVKPHSPLAMRTAYLLQVQPSITDTLGNSMGGAAFSISFRTDPGQFDYAKQISIGSSPEAVAVGDLTGDGRNDVAMTNWYSFDSPTDYKLLVFPQQMDGTLGTPVAYATQATYGCAPSSMAVADVNGDGREDVVIGESGCGIEIFLQDGTGSLLSSAFIATAESHRIRVADFDGDGRMDIAGAGWGTGQVAIVMQTAAGTLAGPTSWAVSHAGWEDLDIGDVNGDGRPDVVVSSGQGDTSKALAVLLQLADGTFGNPKYYSLGGSPIRAVATGDVNGDARTDIVVSSLFDSTIGVFYQDASGDLGPMQEIAAGDTVQAIDVTDVNGDGAHDIVVRTGYGFGVCSQQPDGTLSSLQTYSAPISGYFNPESITTGDINTDGRVDLVGAGIVYLTNRGMAPSSSGLSLKAKAGLRTRSGSQRSWVPLNQLPMVQPRAAAR